MNFTCLQREIWQNPFHFNIASKWGLLGFGGLSSILLFWKECSKNYPLTYLRQHVCKDELNDSISVTGLYCRRGNILSPSLLPGSLKGILKMDLTKDRLTREKHTHLFSVFYLMTIVFLRKRRLKQLNIDIFIVVPPYQRFRFPWFYLFVVSWDPKILNGKFQK